MEANGNSCSKTAKFYPFFQKLLMQGCQLQTQILSLSKGQIKKFWCLSDREFPEFFKTHPTFVPGHFQSGLISKIPRTCVFLGHPVPYHLIIPLPRCQCDNLRLFEYDNKSQSWHVTARESWSRWSVNIERILLILKTNDYKNLMLTILDLPVEVCCVAKCLNIPVSI